MPIVSSTVTVGHSQIDGRKYVTEKHTDGLGIVHQAEYLAAGTVNHTSIMAARASSIAASQKAAELDHAVFKAPWNYVLQESTAAELSAYARALYKISRNEGLAKIAVRILEWIVNGRFTDAQIRTDFVLTSAQWTTLKAKMQTLVNNHVAVTGSVGE